MGKLTPTDFYVYRKRMLLSVIAVALFSAILLFIAALEIPGGLANVELTSATQSGNLSSKALVGEQPDNTLFLPYHILQFISMHTLGMTPLAIKLPSIIMAASSLIALFCLFLLWFRKNVAIIGTALTASLTIFLVLAQQGTPMISYFFWAVVLLYSVSMLTHAQKFRPLWLIVAACVTALSLYSPYNIYVVLALFITALIHPHARFAVFRQPIWALILGVILFCFTITPLALALLRHPGLWLDLIGVPHAVSWASILANLGMYANFHHPASELYPKPVYSLGIIILILVGLYRVFTTKYTTKSYTVTTMLVFSIFVLLFSSFSAGFLVFPVALLMAFGVDYLIRKWYGLFPHNPYARLAGILILTVVTIGLGIAGIQRYELGYHYDPRASAAYTTDLTLLNATVAREKKPAITLLVPREQKGFYDIYARRAKSKNHSLSVTSSLASVPQNSVLIVAGSQVSSVPLVPKSVIVSPSSSNADRFYVFENSPN